VMREQPVVRLSRVSYDLRPFSRSAGIVNVLDFYSRVAGGATAQLASAPILRD